PMPTMHAIHPLTHHFNALYSIYTPPRGVGKYSQVKIKAIIMASDITPSIAEKVGESQPRVELMAESRALLALEGMTCASCAMRIEKGLKKVPGVKEASVNLATERADITYDPAQTTVQQMVQKVDAVGYKALPLVAPSPRPVEIEPEQEAESIALLNLEGMTCASCAMRIEKG